MVIPIRSGLSSFIPICEESTRYARPDFISERDVLRQKMTIVPLHALAAAAKP
jgi:hypothetical protein